MVVSNSKVHLSKITFLQRMAIAREVDGLIII